MAWPHAVMAQGAAKRPLVAVLVAGSSKSVARYLGGFPKSLQELGYIEGRDIDIVTRYDDGDMARMPVLADELVQLRPDVILTGTAAAVLGVKETSGAVRNGEYSAVGWAERLRPARVVRTSTCSAMARASSTSMPKYLRASPSAGRPCRGCQ